MAAKLPLLSSATLETTIAWWRGQAISRALFLHHVARITNTLPPSRFVVNLCQDRYIFMVAFAAVGVNGQTNLLPSSRATLHLKQLAEDYLDSATITDTDLESWLVMDAADAADMTGKAIPVIPELPADQLIAIAFTSGSTGRAKPNLKHWHELVNGAWQAQQRFGLSDGINIVATVPPQHMYGLETSIMAPLASGVSVHASRPFFPEDIRVALTELPSKRVLITTPVHLQACINAELDWSEIDFLISATAPLLTTLAKQAEIIFSAPVREIYGCTEAGSIASRRTLDGELWHLYDGFRLRDAVLSGAHLPEPVPLSDQLESCDEYTFKLLGRGEDLVNIAGKRSSLAYLNRQISEIEGVVEGVFILPENTETDIQRLVAVVVAPELNERQILTELARGVDPVFLPRPLIKIDQVPRNETGKVTREALLEVIHQSRSISPDEYKKRCVIPADHPSLAGHFPNNPVVPGVVILDEVVQAFSDWQPDKKLTGMPMVKFLVPLRPEQVFVIRFKKPKGQQVRFECLCENGQPLVRGCLTF